MSKSNIFLFALAFLLFQCKNDTATEKPQQSKGDPTVDVETGAPIRAENAWVDRTCDMVTDTELKTIFGAEGMETLNKTAIPGTSMCLFQWMKPDWMERESNNDQTGATYKEPKNTLSLKIINYGTDVMADQQFAALDPEKNPVNDQKVVGLGDGAVWSTERKILSIKKGHLLLTVQLNYTDEAIDNLPKAQEVAKVALAKM